MSWHIEFYLGYMDKDDQIRPLGPFNSDGELCCIRSSSNSEVKKLADLFTKIQKEQYTYELRDHFWYYIEDFPEFLGCLAVDELPDISGSEGLAYLDMWEIVYILRQMADILNPKKEKKIVVIKAEG